MLSIVNRKQIKRLSLKNTKLVHIFKICILFKYFLGFFKVSIIMQEQTCRKFISSGKIKDVRITPFLADSV